MKTSVFIGTSLDGFIARTNGDLDFLHQVVGSPTAMKSSWPQWMR
jgi:hypothetical protein